LKEKARKPKKKTGSVPSYQKRKELEEHNRKYIGDRKRRVAAVSRTILSKIEGMAKYPEDHREAERLKRKIQEEAGLMKLESFGDQLLHTIGESFISRGESFLNAIPVVSSVGRYFSDLSQEFRDSLNVANSGIEARNAITSMKTAEEGEEYDESEQRESKEMEIALGKVLAACWRITVKEVHDIIRYATLLIYKWTMAYAVLHIYKVRYVIRFYTTQMCHIITEGEERLHSSLLDILLLE
jgi:hypothetical protein